MKLSRRAASGLLIAIVLAGLAGGLLLSRGTTRAAALQPSGIDWARVSERDLNIASVFLTARDRGVRPALDSLARLTAADEALRDQGHSLAHALGRYTMSQRRDLAVMGECTPSFQSGCYHGALEGWFLQGGTVDRASIGGICVPRDPRGFVMRECWHGLGHGMMVQLAGDIRRVLPLCDALAAPEGRRECRDGAFMERAIRAVGATAINVGDGPALGQTGAAGGHAGHGSHGGGGHGAQAASAEPAASGPASREELQQLCTGIEDQYQPSCWAYQPIALFMVHGLDPAAVLGVCDTAPANAVRDCYQGFGKQYLGSVRGDARRMIQACQQGNRALATDCLLGGVEYFTDLEWDIAPGIAFCRQVPGEAKPRCYGMVGERLALVHPDQEGAAAACRQVESAFVDACLAGARGRQS
jgi:hypothetical protein